MFDDILRKQFNDNSNNNNKKKQLKSCAEIKIAMIKGVKASVLAGPVCAVVA